MSQKVPNNSAIEPKSTTKLYLLEMNHYLGSLQFLKINFIRMRNFSSLLLLILLACVQSLIAQNAIADSSSINKISTVHSGQLQISSTDSASSSGWSKMTNVFTPNGDGINDYFTIQTTPGGRYSLYVYTRSGVLVYSSESPKIFWDGRSLSGIEMRQGVYYYIIEGREGEKEIKKKGFVHLFR